jgi:fucose 4-O-acetylase-like acetyltransferase
MQTSNRLAFLDNMKVIMMSVVIMHHVAQAYGPTGGWWPIQEPTRAAVLGPFFMVNRSFGMSLFFMIAGYFTVMSCDRHGPAALAKSRLLRLGIPLIIFSLLVILLQVFVFGPADTGELGAPWPIDVAHFWFVQHLLIYSLVFALWCRFRPQDSRLIVPPKDPPGYLKVLAFAIGMALATAIIRTWYSIDDWVYIFGYIRVAFADVPRDLGMFIVGIIAYRHQWLTRFPSRAGYAWFALGLALAGLWYAYELLLMDTVVISDAVWGLLIPLWESLLCVSMCIGLTVLFREKGSSPGALMRAMSQSTYAAYMLHIFPVLLFQYLAVGLSAGPFLKFLLVSLISVPVSFLLGSLLRRPLRI